MTEAEREYVTRAKTTTPFWWGSTITPAQANYNGTAYAGGATGGNRGQTLPVDSFEANPWGLFQVHGNVYDWVEDCWHDSYQGAPTDGSAWITACTDKTRVLRGGSWSFNPRYLRSADRSYFTARYRFNHIGFRLARTLSPPKS